MPTPGDIQFRTKMHQRGVRPANRPCTARRAIDRSDRPDEYKATAATRNGHVPGSTAGRPRSAHRNGHTVDVRVWSVLKKLEVPGHKR